MRCERCGTLQADGSGYCQVCAAPLVRAAATAPSGAPSSPVPGARSRRLTAITLAAVAFLLLVCLTLAALAFGLSSLIRWA